jgi:hypothetical protein
MDKSLHSGFDGRVKHVFRAFHIGFPHRFTGNVLLPKESGDMID